MAFAARGALRGVKRPRIEKEPWEQEEPRALLQSLGSQLNWGDRAPRANFVIDQYAAYTGLP